MKTVFLDWETFSQVDLRKLGAHKYSKDPSTGILSLAYQISGKDQTRVWLPGELEPEDEFFSADCYLAHNAEFERLIWANVAHRLFGWRCPPLSKWRCTAARVAVLGLPRSLDNAAEALELPFQKDASGHRIMLSMTKPRKPTKKNPSLWFRDPERYTKLIAYNRQDVIVEKAIHDNTPALTQAEQNVWRLDQKINDRGIPIDLELIDLMLAERESLRESGNQRWYQLTGIPKISNNLAFIEWLRNNGIQTNTGDKKFVDQLLKTDVDGDIRKALLLRQDLNLSSLAKLDSMKQRSLHGRIYGGHLYHGAHTGRWTGRGIQIQNFVKGMSAEEQEVAVSALHSGTLHALYAKPLKTMSALLRGCIKASPGKKLVCIDFSQIEARVGAWIAGEKWLLDAFRNQEDIYSITASRVYHKPVAEISSKERDLGKCLTLACQYQMGGPRFHQTAEDWGVPISKDLAIEAVQVYRDTNSNIRKYWYELQAAAAEAILHPNRGAAVGFQKVGFKSDGTWLYLKMPSGRKLVYREPKAEWKQTSRGKRLQLSYRGVDSYTHKWKQLHIYGGKFMENLVQALARDVLVHKMFLIDDDILSPIVFHVHDEVVLECPEDTDRLDHLVAVMQEPLAWCSDCPIEVKGFVSERYRKE